MHFFTIFFLIIYSVINLKDGDHFKYQFLVSEAEILIVDSEYELALKKYEEAFNHWDNFFAIDAYNALVCAIKVDNFHTANKYGYFLYDKRGIPKSFFKKNVFRLWLESKRGIEFDKEINGRKSKFRPNERIRDFCLELNEKDQAERGFRTAYHIKEVREKIDSIDFENFKMLIQLMDRSGFPSEENIGIFMKNDTTLSLTNPVRIVVWHFFQKHNKPYLDKMEYLLRKNAKVGTVNPENLASALEHRQGDRNNFGTREVYMFNNNLYVSKKSNFSLFDKNRAEIGAEPYEDFLKKILFNFKQNEFVLVSSGIINIDGLRKKDQEKIIKNSTKIEIE